MCVCGGGIPALFGLNVHFSHIPPTAGTVYSLSEPLVISPLHCSAAYEKGNFLPCYLKSAACDLLPAGPDLQNLLSEDKSDMSEL